MNIKNEYVKLYQHWLKEYKKKTITPLLEGNLNDYKKCLDFLNEANLDKKEEVKHQKIGSMIITSYNNNYKFLFKDFLKIREIKIINSALALQEIDMDNLLEAEKLFYKNLVSDFKGFKKIKTLTLDAVDIKGIAEKDIELKEPQTLEINKIDNHNHDQIIKDIHEQFKFKSNEFNYTLLRFLKETPPLVGVDLINYGPFLKEDIAFLPINNAKILINEKFAEKIEI